MHDINIYEMNEMVLLSKRVNEHEMFTTQLYKPLRQRNIHVLCLFSFCK